MRLRAGARAGLPTYSRWLMVSACWVITLLGRFHVVHADISGLDVAGSTFSIRQDTIAGEIRFDGFDYEVVS
jgi:hypothetical protein